MRATSLIVTALLAAGCSLPADPAPRAAPNRSLAPAPVPEAEPEPEPLGPRILSEAPREARTESKDDLEARKAEARAHFGAKVRLAVVEDVFLMVGAPPMSQAMFDRALSLTRRAAAGYFNGRFGRRPPRAISVYLFASLKPYEAFCDQHHGGCGTPYGVYYREQRRIVMNGGPGLGTLTHELVHPILESDFPGAPDWIDEGIASLFERPSIPRPGEIHGLTNWRLPRLVRAIRAKDPDAGLPWLFASATAGFRGNKEDLGYAMARYLCQWLDEQGVLWSFYARWRDTIDRDPTGERAFVEVTGMDLPTATAAWHRWARKL